MAVSRRLRFEVLKRDGHACRYCGETAPTVKLTVDHVIPKALGGADDPTNLVTACQPCNSGKSSVPADAPTVAQVSDDAVRLAEALRLVMEGREIEHEGLMMMIDEFGDAWKGWRYGPEDNRQWCPMDDNWRSSIARFYDMGYSPERLIWFIRVSMESKADIKGKFKYFCGCVWNDFATVQADAMSLAERMKGAA